MGLEFERYQHVERLGTLETNGILDGKVYVFYKLDGSNGQLWYDVNTATIEAGSRNRTLTLYNDNAGFLTWATKQGNLQDFFETNPELRLFGEWLVPHSLKTYVDEAWRRFYVFDVVDTRNGSVLPYEAYRPLLEGFGIDYIPAMATINNPNEENILRFLERSGEFLIKDGAGRGEGIVLKNYDFVNKFGRQTWAKLVTNEFKILNYKEFGTPLINSTALIEEVIVRDFLTETFIEKEKAKIEWEHGGLGWESKFIPELLGRVWYEFVREETYEWTKKLKNPKVNFSLLQKLVQRRVKQYLGIGV